MARTLNIANIPWTAAHGAFSAATPRAPDRLDGVRRARRAESGDDAIGPEVVASPDAVSPDAESGDDGTESLAVVGGTASDSADQDPDHHRAAVAWWSAEGAALALLSTGGAIAALTVPDRASSPNAGTAKPPQSLSPQPILPPSDIVVHDPRRDDHPRAMGLALAGAEVRVTWPDGTQSVAIADADGHWSSDAAGPQKSGVVIAVAHRDGLTSAAAHCRYDDVTPPRPGTLRLDGYEDTGASAIDRLGNARDFNLVIDGHDTSAAVVYQLSADGGVTWTDTPAAPVGLPDGRYRFRAAVTDAAGNVATTDEVGLVLDTQGPEPGVLHADRGADPSTGQQRVTLAVSGQEAGASIRFEVSRDDGMTWLPTGADLPSLQDGDYRFRAVVTDAAGNVSRTSSKSVLVDTVRPVAGTLRLDGFDDTGDSALDFLSRDDHFELRVDVEPGARVVYEHSVDGGATWAVVDPAVRGLPELMHHFRAVVTDGAGNVSVTPTVLVTIDATAPEIGHLDLGQYTGQGNAQVGYRGADHTFTLGVDRHAGGALSYQVSTDGGAHWAPCGTVMDGLMDGDYQFRARVVDPAGNGAISNVVTVGVDTREPIAGSLILTGLDDTGDDAVDRISPDELFQLTLVGSSAAALSTTFQVSRNGGRTWKDTVADQDLRSDGTRLFRAQVIDADGGIHYTRAIALTTDSDPPVAGQLTLQGFEDTGISAADGITRDGDFQLLYSGGSGHSRFDFEFSVNEGWSWRPCGDHLSGLPDGNYLFRVTAYDTTGNGGRSNWVKVVVDTQAPSAGRLVLSEFDDTGAAADLVSQDNSFMLTVADQEASAALRFERSVDGGVTWQVTEAAQSGLADGGYLYRAVALDTAGNEATTGTLAVRVDTAPPAAGALRAEETTTQDGHRTIELLLQGAEVGASVHHEVSVDGGQHWQASTARTTDVPPGDYLFRAVVVDQAGNAAMTAALPVTVAALGLAAAPRDAWIPRVPADGSDSTLAAWLRSPDPALTEGTFWMPPSSPFGMG
ncbi:hypothetical protein CDN99_07980 [Roseateles aquatilis]|uniref:Bacterial Ig-like domain-containing protein n=1 Tax=Roseateles aquatilis TaxID=431061 RepID=A0A246JI06_9BURK|nr:hypothetical protein CDN99_07980 [Roseateles aquatilis]